MELDFATKESQFMPGVFISHARGTFRDEAEYFMHAFTAMRICKKDLLFPLCLGFFFVLDFYLWFLLFWFSQTSSPGIFKERKKERITSHKSSSMSSSPSCHNSKGGFVLFLNGSGVFLKYLNRCSSHRSWGTSASHCPSIMGTLLISMAQIPSWGAACAVL